MILVKKLIRKLASIFNSNKSPLNKHSLNNIHRRPEILNISSFYFFIPDIDELQRYRLELNSRCDTIIAHKFDLLGSGFTLVNVRPDEKGINNSSQIASPNKSLELLNQIDEDYRFIDWHADFVSGFRWDVQKESRTLKYGNQVGVDVKYPWELGRLQHFIPLCYSAALSTADENVYLKEFKNQFLDFTITNPIGFGIQWYSTMDVSIRAINIIFSYIILKKSNVKIDEIFEQALLESISQHSQFIYEHLEWNDGLRGNHYLFNIAGLLVCQLFLESSDNRSEILLFTFQEICNEILYQFNEDGGNFEASLPYHYFAAESVFLCERLINQQKAKKLIFPQNVLDRIEKIKNFSRKNAGLNGCIPQIGDNDSGYLLKIHPADIVNQSDLDVNHLLRYILPVNHNSDYDLFPDFGLYVNRTDNIFLTFRCGSVGQMGKGGHSHNDQLSITLDVANKQFIVDPGTFCYTSNPTERNKYRSTHMHNTMSIAGKEQNLFFNDTLDDLFWMFDRSRAKIVFASARKIHGEHTGYGFKSERVLRFSDREVIGTDKAYNEFEKNIQFHLHPDTVIKEIENGLTLINGEVSIKFLIENDKYFIDEYFYSPGYGKKIKSQKIVITSKASEINWKIEY